MQFTWIDCETGETDVNLFGANGQNDWEKGLGSALTYAERYFLLKYFHIATDEDDIDNDQRKTSAPIEVKQVQTPTLTSQEVEQRNIERLKACTTLQEVAKVWENIKSKTAEIIKVKDEMKNKLSN